MFGISDYGAFCAAVLLFLALPGPGTFALLASTGKGGFRAGAAGTFGLIAGDQVLLWLAVAGVAALLAAHPAVFKAVQYAGAAYLAWLGLKLIFVHESPQGRRHAASAPPGGSKKTWGGPAFSCEAKASPVHIQPRHYARQLFLITLLNPKAIVFYMAFFPLFIDPATHRGGITFVAMAGTIAVLSAAYCLTLCAFAQAVAQKVKANRRAARWLERMAGVFLVGFGIRLGSS